MGVARVAVFANQGNQMRQVLPGDLVASSEIIKTLTTAGASTLTADLLASHLLKRSGVTAGAFDDTTESAGSIISSLLANYFVGSAVNNGGPGSAGGVDQDMSWRFRYINDGTTQIATIVGGDNVTTIGTMTVANNAWRDLLVKILNGTPEKIFTGATITGDATVTGLTQSQTNQLTPGMAVSGTGIPGGTTIIGINPGSGVELSANATGTSSAVALTFSPRVSIENLGGGTL